MPVKDTRVSNTSSTSKTISSTATTSVTEEEESNSEANEKVEAGTAAGLANYESSLGNWLGGELYGAVSNNLTYSKVGQTADGAISSLLKSAAERINLLDDLDNVHVDDGFSDALGQTLSMKFDGLGEEWVNGAGREMVTDLQNWTDANPKTVATVGLLAAAGAVAANMEIPELKHSLGITDELTATMAVKLGRFQNIALEEIRSKLEYHSGDLIMAIEGSYSEDEGSQVGIGISYKW